MKSGILVSILLALVLISGASCAGTTTTTAPTASTTPPPVTSTTPPPETSTTPPTPIITTTEPTPEPPPTTSATPTPTITTGSLTVYCNLLLGSIYLDDVKKGSAQGSYGRTLSDIEAGAHTVKITSDGWGTWSKQVEIVAGEETIIYGYLALGEENASASRNEIITPEAAAAFGSLEVNCGTMQANIYIGGESGGPTASGGRTIRGILPGTYTVQIGTSGWAPWTKQVKIETGKTTVLYAYLALGEDKGAPSRSETITPDMADSYGTLLVYCNLLLGNIYVDGEPGGPPQGSTGKTIRGLLAGTYTVRISEEGWRDWEGQVTITAGQTTEITAQVVQE